jgi:glycosyltransferase involved in cell wall biosynthesis
LGVRFIEIPLSKHGLSIASDIKYFWRLWRLIRLEKPSVTLGYTIKPVIYGSIAARLAGVRNVNAMITGAGYAFTANTFKAKMVRFVVAALYKLGFMAAKNIIFQNPDDLEEFTRRKLVPKKKCRLVNGSGVNMQKFEAAPMPEKISFLMISRMLVGKGVREYLEAARIVKQKHPTVRFVLVGAFEKLPDSLIPAELQSYFADGIVEHHPETPDVKTHYRQCTVYVLPSYREGTPRTVLEAMATARPIITTNVPGCRQTVVNGQNGFLIPPKDPIALAEKMMWFVENPEQAAIMGNASLEICKEKFEVGAINEAMMGIMGVNKWQTD